MNYRSEINLKCRNKASQTRAIAIKLYSNLASISFLAIFIEKIFVASWEKPIITEKAWNVKVLRGRNKTKRTQSRGVNRGRAVNMSLFMG